MAKPPSLRFFTPPALYPCGDIRAVGRLSVLQQVQTGYEP
jgi:hypothetical protein